jgi:glycosyltransferase involved in cell wall biosynthesis
MEEMVDKAMKSAYPDPTELRKYALSRFTSEKMAEGYAEIYEKVCKEHADAENTAEPVCQGSLIPATCTPTSLTPDSKYGEKLRIVQVAPVTFPCPPKDYGGIERVVYDLTEELVHQGHEVYLFAADGSISSGNLIVYDKSIDDASKVGAFVAKNLPQNIDIIHDHTHSCVMNECRLSIPVINTMHDSRENTAKYPVYLCRKALQKVGCSKGFFAYNGINPDDYEFCESKEDYLLFMGMLYAHKGVNFALDIAEKTGKKLILAGPIYNLDYYKKEIEPRIKGNPNIIYAGSVGGKYRQLILKKARCVLFPSVWEEPFGLVMIEAMACGTPVLAFGNGAVPEVMSGFPEMICNNVEEMLNKLQNQEFPKPQELRKYVENNFSAGKMADRYVEIYEKVIEDKHQ